MSVSPNEFWQLLTVSGLVPPHRVEQLRAKISQRPKISLSSSADGVAQLLVANGVLTKYQSRVLMQGKPGPFEFGPYVVQAPSEIVGLAGWFRAKRRSDSAEVLLRVVPEAARDVESSDIIANATSRYPRLGELKVEEHPDCRLLVATSPFASDVVVQFDGVPQARGPITPKVDHVPSTVTWQESSVMASRTFQRKSSWPLPMIYPFVGGLLVICAVTSYMLFRAKVGRQREDGRVAALPVAAEPLKIEDSGDDLTDANPYELTDAADALWARPTAGRPITLRYLPPAVQTIVQLRLASLLQHAEGIRILRSLGPDLETMLATWIQDLGIDRSEIDVLTVGLLPQGTTLPKVIVVLSTLERIDTQSIAKLQVTNDANVARLGSYGVWLPEGDARRTLVIGDADVVSEIAKQKGKVPLFRREIRELRNVTHDTDHVTILATPSFLRTEAQGLFTDSRRILLDGLERIWSDEAQAASFGLQLGDVAIAEMRMIARADMTPLRLANNVRDRLRELPTRVSDYVGRAQLDPYWQRLAIRFPTMVRFLVEQSRVVTEDRQVAVSVAVPVQAVHNLLLASELALASPVTNPRDRRSEDRSTWTLADVLGAKTSFSFSQQSLEAAMQDLAELVRGEFPGIPFTFEIEILGTDLQAEGITRNQQIRGFQQVDQTIRQILTALVMKANPATRVNPSATDQQLVWLTVQEGVPKVLITTRNAAEKNSWRLPRLFREE